MSDILDDEPFDAVMYAYRTAPIEDPAAVVAAFEAVKDFIRREIMSTKVTVVDASVVRDPFSDTGEPLPDGTVTIAIGDFHPEVIRARRVLFCAACGNTYVEGEGHSCQWVSLPADADA